MTRIFVPSRGTKDWKRVYKNPGRQWQKGYPGRALAHCWERADGLPNEISTLFSTSGMPSFRSVDPLIVFLDYQVPTPTGAAHHDLFCLAKDRTGQLVSMAVMGKVLAPFGPSVKKWRKAHAKDAEERLAALQTTLGVNGGIPDDMPFALISHAALAVLTARQFNALTAVLLIHAFGQKPDWVEEYDRFLGLFHAQRTMSGLHLLRHTQGVSLYCGWAEGDAKYLHK